MNARQLPDRAYLDRTSAGGTTYSDEFANTGGSVMGLTTWGFATKRATRKPALLPKCEWCGKPNPPPGTRSNAIDNIDKLGLFCSLRCAARFGALCAARDVA